MTLEATLTSKDGWAEVDRVAVSAHLTGTQALVVNMPQLRMRGDVDLTASGTLGRLLVRGDVAITSGRFAQRITAIPSPESLKSRHELAPHVSITSHQCGAPREIRRRDVVSKGRRIENSFYVTGHRSDTPASVAK